MCLLDATRNAVRGEAVPTLHGGMMTGLSGCLGPGMSAVRLGKAAQAVFAPVTAWTIEGRSRWDVTRLPGLLTAALGAGHGTAGG